MVFSSVLFLFRFLPIFMICYFLVPRNMKNLVLFLGSLVFYAWGEPVYIFLMLFSTISDFVWGRLIEEYRGEDRSRIFLLCSVVINLFILGFFKYADFLLQTVNTVFGTSIPLLGLPLPIGISFYTFQTMSYVIDVYRGDAKAQRNILQFGVYVTMFPQLIAGPILKYHQIEKISSGKAFRSGCHQLRSETLCDGTCEKSSSGQQSRTFVDTDIFPEK